MLLPPRGSTSSTPQLKRYRFSPLLAAPAPPYRRRMLSGLAHIADHQQEKTIASPQLPSRVCSQNFRDKQMLCSLLFYICVVVSVGLKSARRAQHDRWEMNFCAQIGICVTTCGNRTYIPVVPARGGAEVALDLTIRLFSSIELARAVRHACVLCANLLCCCFARAWPACDHVGTQHQANMCCALDTWSHVKSFDLFWHILTSYQLAQSTSHDYFVLQSLHKVLPSITSYYKACTKYFPVLLRTTKLAQSTSRYYFILQSLHKVFPSGAKQPWCSHHNAICRDWVAKRNSTRRSGVRNCSSTTGSPRKSKKNTSLKHFLQRIFKRKIISAKIDKISWQITTAALMQPLQYDLRCPAAKDNSMTRAAVAPSNLDAAITMPSAQTQLQNAVELRARRQKLQLQSRISTQKQKNKILKHLLQRVLEGKSPVPKLTKSAEKSSQSTTIYDIQLQKTLLSRNTKQQSSCSHYTAICNQRVKKRIELRTHEQPLVAEHRVWPKPHPSHTGGTCHRRPEPLYLKKDKVSCPGFLPKRSPCNMHAATTLHGV